MSKLYKATIYIDDINNKFDNIENIKQELINNIEDLTFTFDDIKEKDTTAYINEVEDNYAWNTIDEYTRAVVLHNLFAGDEVE